MAFRDIPIRRKLMAMMLLTSGTVLLLACCAFIGYEYFAFRGNAVRKLETLARIIANGSTAALAFDNQADAATVLASLRAEPQIVGAALYTSDGKLFAQYPAAPAPAAPDARQPDGYRFQHGNLVGIEPVAELPGKRLGTLYLKSDLQALHEQLALYSLIALAMTGVAFVVAYVLSRFLQSRISAPVLALADIARTVSERRDYTVRARRLGRDELGRLTDAFNEMLERIEAQNQHLRQNEARVRAVLDSALSAVIVIDIQGQVLEWNPRAEQIFGWSRAEMLGKDLAETVLPPQYREAHRRALQRFASTGHGTILNRPLELSALRQDGREFPVELSVTLLQSGGTLAFCGFLTDITERQQAQTRLQVQLTRLDLLNRITRAIAERQDLASIFQAVIRRLEDHLPIDFSCICLNDPAQQMLTVNTVGVRMQALATELAVTEQSRIPADRNGLSRCLRGELVYDPDIAMSPYPFPSRLARGGLRSLVIAPLSVERSTFGVLVIARQVPEGFTSGDCEFVRQLCDHVALAAHQAQLYGDLQKAYEELRQTQQNVLQQERLRALGQMASGVAHDINNAISPVALYAESLLERETGLTERARSSLIVIQRAVNDVAHTVSRMREFYRPREPQLMSSGIDLARLVREVIELTRARWRDQPQQQGVVIDLRTDLAVQLPAISGAESELRDALTNLIFNAVDAMPTGGTLTIRTRAFAPAQQGRVKGDAAVCLEVSDTGIGMSDETRRHCLEPFFTTKGERGTGMGLAMVYGMAQRHAADLEIESAAGSGTTVRLIFPQSSTAGQMPEPASAGGPLRPLRILLVDDDPLILESLQETLTHDGHSITAANGGAAGVEVFTAARAGGKPFDIVITDLGMPYVDGRRVASAIKALAPATPVILLTGWGQRLVDDDGVPAEVDRVLSKPPKLRELRSALGALSTRNAVS